MNEKCQHRITYILVRRDFMIDDLFLTLFLSEGSVSVAARSLQFAGFDFMSKRL